VTARLRITICLLAYSAAGLLTIVIFH